MRPWNEPSSATIPGFPVALRAYLIAASIASAPELQKNASAPPNRSESSPASAAIGSVQYRFETCQRRSSCACAAASGAGWQCPSADDRDPGGEVEEAAAVRGGQPCALALDEGDVGATRTSGARACGSARSRGHHRLADLSVHAAARRLDRRPQLRDDAALERPVVEQPVGLVGPDATRARRRAARRGRRSGTVIRSAPRPTASAAAASSAFTFSGPSASGETTGIEPGCERVDDRLADGSAAGRRRVRARARARPGARSRRRPARSRRGSDRRAELRVDRGSVSRTTPIAASPVIAAAADEGDVESSPLHLRRDLRPGAVHDQTSSCAAAARSRSTADPATAPPHLEHDAHVVYSALMRT